MKLCDVNQLGRLHLYEHTFEQPFISSGFRKIVEGEVSFTLGQIISGAKS